MSSVAFLLPQQASPAVSAPATSAAALPRAAAPQAGWSASGAAAATAAAFAAAAAVRPAATAARRRQAKSSVRVVRAAKEVESQEDLATFPFSAVVGQKEMKLALCLNLVDPVIGGVMIQGERGTGKSACVRGMVRLLPDIECVEGDKYNSDPQNVGLMSDDARNRMNDGEPLPTVFKRTPFVELPLGATEDRVTGTIDIEAALLEGGKAFEPGILAKVNRGILYIDEVNLLDDQLVDVLLDSAAGGWNTVEREGISIRHPARFILIGTAHPDEGDLRPQMLDRFGLTVGIRTQNDPQTRLEVLTRTSEWSLNRKKVLDEFGLQDSGLKAKVIDARNRLKEVTITSKLKLKISKICSALNVDGLRGDIVLNRTSRALAAFEGRDEVTEDDILRVACMCLQHRLRKDVVNDSLDNSFLVVEALIREFGRGPPRSVEEDREDVPQETVELL